MKNPEVSRLLGDVEVFYLPVWTNHLDLLSELSGTVKVQTVVWTLSQEGGLCLSLKSWWKVEKFGQECRFAVAKKSRLYYVNKFEFFAVIKHFSLLLQEVVMQWTT